MEVLSEIIRDYPDVKIRLVSGNADEMETALKHGTIDFAVLMAHRSLDSYHHLQLPETDRWGLAMQKDNPLAQKNAIKPADLIGLPLLVSEQALDEHRFQDWWGNVGNNLRLVQNENNRSGLFCYPKDRAKVAHSFWDCESVLKNNLRYLCFQVVELRVRV